MARGSESDFGALPNPRAVRARRRHRRRVIGTFIFIAVAIGLIGGAYLLVADSSNSTTSATSATTGPRATTTTAGPRPPAGPFPVTDNVNIREGPGTQYKIVGTVSSGHKVLVVCAIDGQSVNGPNGQSTKWLRITGLGPVGYVTVVYVDIGTAIDNPSVVPICPGI